MTALNIFASNDAVHISTDGVAYDPNGKLLGEAQKVFVIGNIPAVVAVRGPTVLLYQIGISVSLNSIDFDHALTVIGALVQALMNEYQKDMASRGFGEISYKDLEVSFSGLSKKRDRIETYIISSRSDQNSGPWKLNEVPDFAIAPMDANISDKILENREKLDSIYSDPDGAAVWLMEIQRSETPILFGNRRVPGAGGFCQLTSITRDGIHTRILRRWPTPWSPS